MKTMRNGVAALAALLMVAGYGGGIRAAAAAEALQTSKPKATRAEYDAYSAAAAEKSAQERVKLLDAFLAKYPNSEYLAYDAAGNGVYMEYWKTYVALKQWTKSIEYLDKLLSLSEVASGAKLDFYYRRAATFEYAYNAKSPDLADGSTKARDAALEGLKMLSAFRKPEKISDDQWATIKKSYTMQFDNTAASASYYLKDYKGAAQNYHAALEAEPKQPVDDYRMGLADLQETPPESTAGLWALARAIDLKVPDTDKVTAYLHDRISELQAPVCESALDAEEKELLTLAQNSQDPPANYSLPGQAELAKKREQDVPTLLTVLRAGGDDAKVSWIAVCNGVFPEAFLGKVYEVNATDPNAIDIKAAAGTTEDAVNASTAADVELKITTQPEAARLGKDDIFRFAGKLTGYTANPFQLAFEDVKINPEDIPAEKGKKPTRHPGKAKPGAGGR